ncbi:hypothetical protein GCM10022197_15020 [Microlunatus spumicola]|uniref:DUF4829 domain-containing protein n=1 Tax=Microlunatus spumicola TaxID=81499 RepID=A0ABP6X866_9ACTN
MVLAAAGSTQRSASRRRLVVGLVVAVVLSVTLAAGYGLGFRLNLQTRSVPLPTAAASPEEVVRTYTEAYDHRDFATMAAIYPSDRSAFSRFRAMGTMRDLQITQSRVASESDLSGTFPKAGHSYYRVEVTLDYTGLTGSDFSFDDGPNGWTYWLERSTASDPWTITDQGNG